jgi:hypothetical protein
LEGALLNDDAALVQQFAGLGEHESAGCSASDLVDHHVGFRLYQGVLRKDDVPPAFAMMPGRHPGGLAQGFSC